MKKLESIITIRLKDFEKIKVKNEAKLLGFSLSSYVRKKILGYKIVPRIELTLINELRRQGGLLKNNFQILRNTNEKNALSTLKIQEDVLLEIKDLIKKISDDFEMNKFNEENNDS